MNLIAMAGLPGTGKSTLARALGVRLGLQVIDKDHLRATLFGAQVDYTREQDDLVCGAMYAAVEYLARKRVAEGAILDGRTYSQRYQVDELRRVASRCGARLFVFECTCEAETARARLEHDEREGSHAAGNRSFELYRSLAAAAEPIVGEKLVLATDGAPVEQQVERCLAWLRERGAPSANAP